MGVMHRDFVHSHNHRIGPARLRRRRLRASVGPIDWIFAALVGLLVLGSLMWVERRVDVHPQKSSSVHARISQESRQTHSGPLISDEGEVSRGNAATNHKAPILSTRP